MLLSAVGLFVLNGPCAGLEEVLKDRFGRRPARRRRRRWWWVQDSARS